MILTALVAMAQATQAPNLKCDAWLSQRDMNTCASRDFQRADAEMNAQWKITAVRMKKVDADIDRSFDKRPSSYNTLLAAQRAWLTYRDQHCATEGYTMRGGSAERMMINQCMARLTKARTKQLGELAEGH